MQQPAESTPKVFCHLGCPCLTVQVTMKGSGIALTASAQHNSATTAKQQAALDLIHQLQQAILAMLTASASDKVIPAATQSSPGNSTSPAMKTLHEGDLENSMPEIGNVVKVQYQLIRDCQEGLNQEVQNTTKDNDGESPSKVGAIWSPTCLQICLMHLNVNLGLQHGIWQCICRQQCSMQCLFMWGKCTLSSAI